ncbi:hypothetical protein SDC9_203351 [bioreactor metagenome]|uniref:Uncharacterized protein n=1 Tax=bioreactor metagenome TaxID=1076179 RepID=A0A645IWZ7_9ZZZZ
MIEFNDILRMNRCLCGNDRHVFFDCENLRNPIGTGHAFGIHDKHPADGQHGICDNRKIVGKGNDFTGFAESVIDSISPGHNDQHQTDIHHQVHQWIDRGHLNCRLTFFKEQVLINLSVTFLFMTGFR